MFKIIGAILLAAASLSFAVFSVMFFSAENAPQLVMSAEELLCTETIAEYQESIATWDESIAGAKSDVQSALEELYGAA